MVGIWEKHPKFPGHSPFYDSIVLLPCIRESSDTYQFINKLPGGERVKVPCSRYHILARTTARSILRTMRANTCEKKDQKTTLGEQGVRTFKIHPLYRKNRDEYVKTAEIRLSGNWLEKLGFQQGQRVKVITRQGLLIVRPVRENTFC